MTGFGANLHKHLVSLVSSAYSAFDRSDRLVVLSLHRIGHGWPINPEVLRRHLEYLQSNFHLSLPSRVLEEGIRGRVALVVVDDAHGDIYEVLYPLARALRVPFSIAVPTDFFLRGQWLWFDALRWLLDHASGEVSVQLNDDLTVRSGDTVSIAACKAALKRLLPEERAEWLERLARGFRLRLPARPTVRYRSLTYEEMREMLASCLVELCPHSVTHTVATVLPPAQLRKELVACKVELEEFARRAWPAFCYPDGEQWTFSTQTAAALAAAGYRLAFTSLAGINRPTRLDWYALRRVHIHPSLSVLRKHATGLGETLERWRQRPDRSGAAANAGL